MNERSVFKYKGRKLSPACPDPAPPTTPISGSARD
jgi:hypothetical protein